MSNEPILNELQPSEHVWQRCPCADCEQHRAQLESEHAAEPPPPAPRRAPIFDAVAPSVVCSWRQSPACMPIITAGDPIKVHRGICPACAEHMRREMESIDQITR